MLDRPTPLHLIDPTSDFLSRIGPNRRLDREAPQNDLEAINTFLNEYTSSPDTYRTFHRECERLLNWALIIKGKSLSELDREDFDVYFLFLAKPEPNLLWCGLRAKRETDAWRPFVKGLSESSMVTAVASLNTFFNYLTERFYLHGNPLGLAKQVRKKLREAYLIAHPKDNDEPDGGVHGALSFAEKNDDQKIERYLDDREWLEFTATIESMPKESPLQLDEYHRARFIAAFLMLLAPRASEIVSGKMCSFTKKRGYWKWRVIGKGNKLALLPVSEKMLDELRIYRRHFGMPELPSSSDTNPLVFNLARRRPGANLAPLTQRRLHQILKDLFQETAERIKPMDAASAENLAAASTHWGRHTAITGKINAGIDLRIVAKLGRHTDTRTTLLYTHDDDERLLAEAEKQALPWASGQAVDLPPIEPDGDD